LISDFHLSVEGQKVVSDFIAWQKAFARTQISTLKPDAYTAVSFENTSNEPWRDSGSDILRGARERHLSRNQ
jgi:hypothetical protein